MSLNEGKEINQTVDLKRVQNVACFFFELLTASSGSANNKINKSNGA